MMDHIIYIELFFWIMFQSKLFLYNIAVVKWLLLFESDCCILKLSCIIMTYVSLRSYILFDVFIF